MVFCFKWYFNNHESRRGENFVTKNNRAEVAYGIDQFIYLGSR